MKHIRQLFHQVEHILAINILIFTHNNNGWWNIKNKSCSLNKRGEYQKIKEEYNNLFGFNLGNSEHTSDQNKTDLSLNIVKERINLKKR